MRSDYMAHALKLARKGCYSTSPNPMVGCVIVQSDVIIAEGWHQRAGADHAEIAALKNATIDVAGASLYVTLEPCCHHGRTPPCIDAIIRADIQEVMVGCLDANPQVAGKGVLALRNAGITVTVGLLQEECQQLNRYFLHAMQTKKPYVIAKWAMSLDGKIASKDHDTKWISNSESRALVHETRHLVDAILVGAGTVLADDPQLTVRKPKQNIPHVEQPLRIILDGTNPLSPTAKLFQTDLPGTTMLASELVGNQSYDLEELLLALGKKNIRSLLVEGGAQVLTSFFEEKLVDEMQCFIAPKLIGGAKALTPYMGEGISQVVDAQCFSLIDCSRVGDDVLLTYQKGVN